MFFRFFLIFCAQFQILLATEQDSSRDLILHKYEVGALKCDAHYIPDEKFFLRAQLPEDHIAFRMTLTNPKTMKYLGKGKTYTFEEVEEIITRGSRQSLLTSPRFLHWSLVTHEGCVGRITIFFPEDQSKPKEIAYFVNPDQQGRGLAPSGTKSVMSYYGGDFFATAHPQNIPSKRVLEKLGFVADLHRQNVFLENYNAPRDYYIYRGEK